MCECWGPQARVTFSPYKRALRPRPHSQYIKEIWKFTGFILKTHHYLNDFRLHCTWKIKKRNSHRSFSTYAWRNLGQGNHLAIGTSSFSKTSVFKMLWVHTKMKSLWKRGFWKWINNKSRRFCIKETNQQLGSEFFWNECKGRRVRSQVMKGLAFTSHVNLHGLIVFTSPIISLFLSSFSYFFLPQLLLLPGFSLHSIEWKRKYSLLTATGENILAPNHW